MRVLWFAFAGSLIIAVQGVAAKQLSAPAAPSETTACELHVWPGSAPGSVYHGWFHGSIVNGAVDGRKGYPKVPANQLDTATQARLLDDIQLPALLGRPADRLVLHSEALDSRAIRTTPGRLVADGTGCYAELIVDDLILKQDAVNGSFLSVLYRFRDFGSAAQPSRTFSTWVKTPLKKMAVQGATGDEAAATEELQVAYRNDIKLFAAALTKPPRTKEH